MQPPAAAQSCHSHQAPQPEAQSEPSEPIHCIMNGRITGPPPNCSADVQQQGMQLPARVSPGHSSCLRIRNTQLHGSMAAPQATAHQAPDAQPSLHQAQPLSFLGQRASHQHEPAQQEHADAAMPMEIDAARESADGNPGVTTAAGRESQRKIARKAPHGWMGPSSVIIPRGAIFHSASFPRKPGLPSHRASLSLSLDMWDADVMIFLTLHQQKQK